MPSKILKVIKVGVLHINSFIINRLWTMRNQLYQVDSGMKGSSGHPSTRSFPARAAMLHVTRACPPVPPSKDVGGTVNTMRCWGLAEDNVWLKASADKEHGTNPACVYMPSTRNHSETQTTMTIMTNIIMMVTTNIII